MASEGHNDSLGDGKGVHWSPNMPQQPPASQTSSVSIKPVQGSTGACDACRARKVRCLANESSMSNKCQRCARAGRECVYTVHSKTRRRKRTDTRVKELEEKVKNLSMLLEQGRLDGKAGPLLQSHSLQEDDDADEDEDDDEEGDSTDADGEESPPLHATMTPNNPHNFDGREAFSTLHMAKVHAKEKEKVKKEASDSPKRQTWSDRNITGSTSPDVIDRGLLTLEKSQELIDRYINVLAPHYPAVLIPPGTRAVDLRRDRPVLFIAICAAAAGNQDPQMNLALNQEVLQIYAKKVALKGEKSLDLVQSMLISILWYYPPDRFEELKFHQYIHMAATMALDLGMGRRPRPRASDQMSLRDSLMPQLEAASVTSRGSVSFSSKSFPDPTSIESRRTLLACYLSCSSVSISLRMPNMLRFTSWMEDCLATLETSPDAAPTDIRFAAWIRLQRLVEECNLTFSLDDPGSAVSLSDPDTQEMLKGYERQMDTLKKHFKYTPGLLNDFLEISLHINNMYIHEVALHPEHDSEDFRPPFFISSNNIKSGSKMGFAYVAAVMECVSSAQSALKIFINMEPDLARALPAFLFSRTLYCAIVLIKLDVSTKTPTSEIGKIVDRESLMTRMYVEKALFHMKEIAGTDGKCVVGAKFFTIFAKLVAWYRSISHNAAMFNHRMNVDANRHRTNSTPQEAQPSSHVPPQTFPENPITHALQSAPYPPRRPVFEDSKFFAGVPKHPGPTQMPASTAATNQVVGVRGTTNVSLNINSEFSNVNTSSVTPNGYGTGQTETQNHGTPATDYSSPETMDVSGDVLGRLPYNIPMEMDPNIFNQLEGLNPFSFNQDPNDWMFDGMDYTGIENVEGLDWTAMSLPGGMPQ